MCSFRRAVSRSSSSASQASRSAGEGHRGAGGFWKFLIIGENAFQSVSDHRGRFGPGIRLGEARFIVIGTWSESVEGRETSQPFTNGRRRGFAKDRSMTKGQAFATKGNLVYTLGLLRRAKAPCAAFSKYGDEETISRGENDRSGSERCLWMLRSPTTRRGRQEPGRGCLEQPSGLDAPACWWSRRLLS